jgi:hypothetical protein
MFGRKKTKRSLIKRLFTYLVLLASGSGISGWALKDHPTVQALLTLVTGDPSKDDPADVEKALMGDVADLLKKTPDFTQAGLYQVTITKVELDQTQFKPGHTVDIQAKVTRRDGRGQDAVVWDSRSYGERLAVVGKDSLTAGWPNRPFQVEWKPGEVVFLEVYDRKNGFFAAPKRFTLSSSNGAADFPLKTGDFALEPQQKANPPLDPRLTHVVLNSQVVGDLKNAAGSTATASESATAARTPARVADDSDRPIVIK